jgi:predicted O-linked N-acetylglucosamine transferase (SPINDLY family)
LLDQGAIAEGIALLGRAVSVDPAQAAGHFSLARAHLAAGRADIALGSLQRAVELDSALADAWFLRGNLLQQAGRHAESAKCYERAIAARPAFPEAFNNLSAALRALRQMPRALECAERALALRPSYAKALNNRGLIRLDANRPAAAVEDFRQALALDGTFAEALHNLGSALTQLRRHEEACDAYLRLADLSPGFPHVHGNVLSAKLNVCDWSDYDARKGAVIEAVARGGHGDVPTSFLCTAGSAALQLRCAQIYSATYYPAQGAYPRGTARPRERRIRIAYLSGDFGEHAVSYLLAGVFERHDRTRFESFALSWDRRQEGGSRKRVAAAFAQFIDITTASDAEVVRAMRELEIDIAVDLTGHTLGHRTDIFARRAAPVQVNYLGHPATMGAPYMDYLIADRFLVPEDREKDYAEKIVRLPCFQPNDDRRVLPPATGSRAAHGLPERGFVFCSFNNNAKLNPAVFDRWMRVLTQIPDGILWLLASTPRVAENLRREARHRGVDPDRLVFAGQKPYREHLERYALADLFLDSSPFNGGATASDALSMGIPVLTCAGDSFASRMAGSLLSYLGLGELVTGSLEEYEARAIALATNQLPLGPLRDRLRQARTAHPFFDTDHYRRCLEAAYVTMWERSAADLPPAAFSVELS